MNARFLLELFREFGNQTAVVWKDEPYTYSWLLAEIEAQAAYLSKDCRPGSTVALVADFSPHSVAVLLALDSLDCILVPVAETVQELQKRLIRLSHADLVIHLDSSDHPELIKRERQIVPPLYARLREGKQSGLVLFTSGVSGQTKVAVHSMGSLLSKFRRRRHRRTTLSFLLYDHIGGINTLFYTLSNGGALVTVPDRRPETVARAIEKHRVELLPTSPTFLNLFLLSGAHRRHDMSSLKVVTYGTERMHQNVLEQLIDELPHVQAQQTYGLSEVGILRSKSENPRSTWVKLGGPEFEIRVVHGVLQVKADSAMLGYLNAANPFTDDGWFITGDRVEQKGEYLRILGRDSGMINAGGVNVYPAEVENVLIADPQVAEVRVYGRATEFGGEVCADIRLVAPEPVDTLFVRLRKACAAHLSEAKVPTKINVVTDPLHNSRFKTGLFPIGDGPGRRVGFVVSGQGPNWPRTGSALLSRWPVFRIALEEFDQALRAMRPMADWSLLNLLATAAGQAELDSTDKGQPAHFAYQVGLARLWAHWGVLPAAVVGHSMGEIATAHIAGALNFEDAVRVVVNRAEVTQHGAGKGKMASLALPMLRAEEELRPWSTLSVCAHNEPPNCVVAGETSALHQFIEAMNAKGIRASLLPFDYAFHSPVMRPFRQRLVDSLEGISPSKTNLPIASTVRAQFLQGNSFDADYWGDNICQPVRFVDGVNLLMDAACDAFLEIGPRPLLVESMRECLAHRGYDANVYHSLARAKPDLEEIEAQCKALTGHLPVG